MSSADIILIGCTATKFDHRAPAADLYMLSDLFRRRRAYAETTGRPWAILSALHGVVDPTRELDPYNHTIADTMRGKPIPAIHWAIHTIQSAYRLAGHVTDIGLPDCSGPLTIEVHAGIDYVRTLTDGLRAFASSDITITHPVAGMQIGQQKQHYARPAPEDLPALGQLVLAF